MSLTRRRALKLAAVSGAAATSAGCSFVARRITPVVIASDIRLPDTNIDPIVRLLNRTGFGPIPGQIAKIKLKGMKQYLSEQLHPSVEEPQILKLRLAHLEALQVSSSELGDLPPDEIIRQLQMSCLLHAIYSPHQLRERMVDFWTNHFNIYARKGPSPYFKPKDDIQVIRKHALGSVHDLIRASAHSPAMLQYLDNQVNQKKDQKGAGANENYARELLELHTLGVHAGYTQKDVQEVARCLTGWTVEDRFMHRKGAFRYDDSRHDKGAKTVLGVRIPPNGDQSDGEKALDILVSHPATAKFISSKICRYFLGDHSDHWSERMAQTYLDTSGDIVQMIQPLLESQILQNSPPILKRPFDFTVSSIRAFAADTNGDKPLQDHIGKMGQPLFQWPMPDGYPDKTGAWTGSILPRWNFATAFAEGSIRGTAIDWTALHKRQRWNSPQSAVESAVQLTALPRHNSENPGSGARIISYLKDRNITDRSQLSVLAASLCLSSPEFQWR